MIFKRLPSHISSQHILHLILDTFGKVLTRIIWLWLWWEKRWSDGESQVPVSPCFWVKLERFTLTIPFYLMLHDEM